jgi:hypothetical protein
MHIVIDSHICKNIQITVSFHPYRDIISLYYSMYALPGIDRSPHNAYTYINIYIYAYGD